MVTNAICRKHCLHLVPPSDPSVGWSLRVIALIHCLPAWAASSSSPLPMPPPPPPPLPAGDSLAAVAHSVDSLASFSDVLADFLDQWNALNVHANAILAALPPLGDPDQERMPSPNPVPVAALGDFLSKSSSVLLQAAAVPVADLVPESSPKPDPAAEHLLRQRNPAPADADGSPFPNPVPESEPEPVLSAEPEPVLSNVVEPNPVPEPEPKPKPRRERRAGEPSEAALATICSQMGSWVLRRFATAHLRDRAWLRRVGPDALRRASDPATLVLRAVGRYYICAESENAEAACVLLLELYVRAGCPRGGKPEGEAELRAEARAAALSWRSRIVRDKGRVADASTRDGRGLVLLMAAFGVPAEFPLPEVHELLLAGDCLACTDVLKCSQIFLKKLRDVVADMLNRGSYREAIGVILGFELQDAFPLADILTYMVEKVVHDRKDQETEGQGDLAGSTEHDEEELVLWRSILKCVEEHTPGSSEMSCFSITERIKVLEERVVTSYTMTASLSIN
ncbi:unnamed protein product [Alopecurus aequalis]